ncbi:hypothetical protein FRC01_010224 [Tulasnella sp. 417]|nr:hypothetical protein FRC01_010224 [Tulasnella sp. 417]
MHNVHSTSKVQPRPEVTPISLPSQDWWLQPRANPAIPSHLRSSTVPAPSTTHQPAKQTTAAEHALFSLFGGPVGPKSPEVEDPYEEALDDQTDGDFPSSPAAMFLTGINSPSGSLRSNSMSMSFSSPNRPRIVPPAEEIIGNYRLGPVIGHGAFSTVKRATSVSSTPSTPSTVAAVKIVLKNDARPGASEARVRLSKESKLWSQLSHEHILPLFQTIETEEATFLFTLYCPAGTLLDVINSHKTDGLEGVGMDDAGMLFRQVVRGLKYLHEVVRLVHGDIKLENVLVDDQGSCRIADFGLARWMQEHSEEKPSTASASLEPPAQRENGTLSLHDSLRRTRGRNRLPSRLSNSFTDEQDTNSSGSAANKNAQYYFPPGSLPYAAPELLRPVNSATIPPANPAQDIWALGCVLYALLFGQLPFRDPFEPRLTMKILSGIWRLPSNYRPSGPMSSRPGRRSQSGSRTRSGSARGVSRSRTRDRSASRTRTKAGTMLTSPVTARVRPRSKSRGRTVPASATPNSQAQLKTIGRVAENVLHGCLSTDLQQRWTISMIDEVGWGVGWDLDVDEAGEEYEEEMDAGEMTSSSSGNTSASEAMSFQPFQPDLGEHTKDRFGNRLYIPPSTSTSSDVSNSLFETTLNLVTSPHATSGRRIEPVKEKSESEHDFVVVESAATVETEAQPSEEPGKEPRSRSRGKRGKASRSSSRAPAISSLTPSPPASSISSPSAQDSSDPFQAFREGYIPPSVIPLLNSASMASSRPSSRAPSAPQSRSSSKERGDNRGEWARGRPTTSSNGSWRIVGSSGSRSAGHHTPALPTIDSGRSFEEPIGLWRRPQESGSISPSQSPAPETPIDRDAGNRRSRSRGRIGGSRLSTRVGFVEMSSSVPNSARDFGPPHSRPPHREYHGSHPNLPSAMDKAVNGLEDVERGRRGASVEYRVNWKADSD